MSDPKIKQQELKAGGMPAIVSSVRQAFGKMGMFRSAKTLLKVNQKDGFDCPGCAWPDPDDRRQMVEFCENGAKAVAEEATLARITPEFFREWSLDHLKEQSGFWLGSQGRLTVPMALKPNSKNYEPISWAEAFEWISEELNSLNSPDQAIFYTSGRTSNEAAFLFQLFVRIFGTNNLPDCSNMCHESSGVALTEVIGSGKGTVTLEDFDHADCIMVIGQNPGTNHPRMLTTLQQAARRGCKIITINPLLEAGTNRFIHPQEIMQWWGSGTQLTHLFLQVRINGDVALLKGIMKEVLTEEEKRPGQILDHEFIKSHTAGFEKFAEDIRQTPWDLILKESGVDRVQMQEAASIITQSKRMICCWAMGMTQHRNAVANIQEIMNLLFLGGHIGRQGAGACPVRGHSNVQGDRTMGINEKPPAVFLDRLAKVFEFEPPREAGLDTVESIRAMYEGRAKVFIALGGNFLSAAPDTAYTTEALKRCNLTVQVSTKLNQAHLVPGKRALILPCLGRTEIDLQKSGPQFVTVENSMGVVHSSRGNLKPGSENLLSEVSIVTRLAKAVFMGNSAKSKIVDWDELEESYDQIRDRIAEVIVGFENYNDRIQKTQGFSLPHAVRDSRTFLNKTGKALFTIHPIHESELENGEFLMMTIRSHDQYNTTIYGMDDRYRGIYSGRRVILMNPDDIRESFFEKGTQVDITGHYKGETRVAHGFSVVPYDLPRGCVATYFPEANVLVPLDHTAEKSNTPASKSVVVSVRKS